MNMYPSFTTLRSSVSYKFSELRMRALRDSYLKKLIGAESKLEVFPGKESGISPSRKLIGIKNIRVDQIVGTLYREADFDRQFRPLKKHTLERWVHAYIQHEHDGWSPIIVHKAGEQYFVEDGHHRVSVARALHVEFIEAQIWEHNVLNKSAAVCQPIQCTEKSPSKVYVTG